MTFRRFMRSYGYLFTTVIVMLVLFRGIFLLGFVTSGSMESTLPTHSVFLSWHLSYALGDPMPERGDIVLFDSDELGQTLVKRVVGLPGETVSFRDGQVLVKAAPRWKKLICPCRGSLIPKTRETVSPCPTVASFCWGTTGTILWTAASGKTPLFP